MEEKELKRFDDTPTPRLKALFDRTIQYNIIQLELSNITNITNIRRSRSHSPKTNTLLNFREPLYSNFKTVLSRVHPQHSITSMLECFMEAYIKTFGKYGNVDIILYHPLHDFQKSEIEEILERAETNEFISRLKIQLKVLRNNPDSFEARQNLRKLLISYRDLLKTTRNPEILDLLKQVEDYL